jgi:aryl-alcohol dehydrogenase-like predicted oxidoreductase
MPLSIQGRPDEAMAVRVIHAALDAGMTLIDTADVYCLDDDELGHNERLIQKAVSERKDRDQILIATKGGLMRPKGAWVSNGRPAHLKQACERSLKALGVEVIDLYQLHAPDSRVPFAESIGALAELQQQGKIRWIGLSNVGVTELEIAKKLVTVVSVQNRLNPFDGSPIVDGVVRYCHQAGITFLPHSPVGGHRGHGRVAEDPVLTQLSQKHGATPQQICLAWLLAMSPVMVPIPGASKVASVESSARAPTITLDAEDKKALIARFPWPGLS